MAERVEIKTITVSAGTTPAAFQTDLLTWREGYPVQVEIRIPPGPSGLLGVALAHSGRKIIPRDQNEWLITDAEPVIWPMSSYPYNAKWSVLSYNQDLYPHTFQVRMLFNELHSGRAEPAPDLDIEPPNEPAESAEDDYVPGDEDTELPPELSGEDE
jgi:hypothetical protein